MAEFSAMKSGSRVLLAPGGTGRQALNVQCANVIIRCLPFWKMSLDEQAIFRDYQTGQNKEVIRTKCERKDVLVTQLEMHSRSISADESMEICHPQS